MKKMKIKSRPGLFWGIGSILALVVIGILFSLVFLRWPFGKGEVPQAVATLVGDYWVDTAYRNERDTYVLMSRTTTLTADEKAWLSEQSFDANEEKTQQIYSQLATAKGFLRPQITAVNGAAQRIVYTLLEYAAEDGVLYCHYTLQLVGVSESALNLTFWGNEDIAVAVNDIESLRATKKTLALDYRNSADVQVTPLNGTGSILALETEINYTPPKEPEEAEDMTVASIYPTVRFGNYEVDSDGVLHFPYLMLTDAAGEVYTSTQTQLLLDDLTQMTIYRTLAGSAGEEAPAIEDLYYDGYALQYTNLENNFVDGPALVEGQLQLLDHVIFFGDNYFIISSLSSRDNVMTMKYGIQREAHDESAKGDLLTIKVTDHMSDDDFSVYNYPHETTRFGQFTWEMVTLSQRLFEFTEITLWVPQGGVLHLPQGG